ncbi:MAG: type IV pilus modification PilV family protein [Acetobacterium sp.]
MLKRLNNQRGVTLIETVASTAIIAIILVTILGALLYGQKMIIFSDGKNNEAAQAQELVDEIMAQLSAKTNEEPLSIIGATKMSSSFIDPNSPIDPRKQYHYVPVDIAGNEVLFENAVGYHIYVRVYYNNDESYIDLKAFTKKGGVNV